MTPYELIARLASLVPDPWEHQLTYQGVLAPALLLRDYVIPRPLLRAGQGVRVPAAKRAIAVRGSGGGAASVEEPSRAPPEKRESRILMPPRQGRLVPSDNYTYPTDNNYIYPSDHGGSVAPSEDESLHHSRNRDPWRRLLGLE